MLFRSEANEKFDAALAKVTVEVAAITNALDAAGIEYRVSGVGISQYIHAEGLAIRVSDHQPPANRGGLRADGLPHDEADMSIHPSSQATAADAVALILASAQEAA